MDGRSAQIHGLEFQGRRSDWRKTGRKKNKTGGVADAEGWGSCGLAVKRYGNTG